jgi:outer membrane protein OmpA-like peptidoglycan-associated protein
LLGLPVSVDAVVSSDLEGLRAAVAALADAHFKFDNGLTLREDDAIRLREYAANVAQLAEAAERIGATLRIAITGHTDAIGPFELNNVLANRRAEIAKAFFVAEGIDPRQISLSGMVDTDSRNGPNPDLKRVSARLNLRPPEGAGPTRPE